jgi:hypothetical protein
LLVFKFRSFAFIQIESLELWIRAVREEKIEEVVDGDALVQKIKRKMGEG